MRLSSTHAAAYALTAATFATVTLAAQEAYDSRLVGTWSTKSNKTLTGPGFYDPVGDNLIEPERTGISYSFTSDGHYEEAYYRAVSNPSSPSCPSGIMQWQHGSYIINSTGETDELVLTPIAVDGRQLLSEPCSYDNAIYTRYNQTETFKRYEVLTDPYHNIARLNLYEFDGSPMAPMYLVYSPPQMLPTTTLNPTTASGTATATATSSSNKKKRERRSVGGGMPVGKARVGATGGREVPSNWKGVVSKEMVNPDRWWWIGLTMTGVGGLLYFGPRRMGIQI